VAASRASSFVNATSPRGVATGVTSKDRFAWYCWIVHLGSAFYAAVTRSPMLCESMVQGTTVLVFEVSQNIQVLLETRTWSKLAVLPLQEN